MDETVYKARYWRYMSEREEECDTLDEAIAFLGNGWERGDLSEIEIIGPDGQVALGGAELHRRMTATLGV